MLAPNLLFSGSVVSSKNPTMLDPLQNMIMLISGSRIVNLHCECAKSQNSRFCGRLVFPDPRQGHVDLQATFFGSFCESQDEVMLDPIKSMSGEVM